ncbi:TIGR03089 family protein [Kineococcus sp. SYSU DK004]|uniref:TIGR03089 family protein n=1 Tax=Kineococcus sp. SYSU DK004 TaxID=3383125 RepID=UPI003D7EAEB8
MARTVPALLQQLSTDDPGTPRLTWYGADSARTGERVELSARVLSTWVAKTANLLEEEFTAGPGTSVGLALPTHWRTVVWQLAVWATGAEVVLGEDAAGADVLVAADAGPLAAALARGGEAVAVDLAPLATSFSGELPDGALDYARVVTGYGDLHVPAPDLAHGPLLAEAAAAARDWPAGVRLLTDAGPERTTGSVLAAFTRTGSVVLVPDLAGLADGVAEQERVTQVLPAR